MKRLGSWALPVAGALYTLGVSLRGRFVAPTKTNAASFASWASRTRYSAAFALVCAAAVVAILGYVALDRRLASKLSGAAMVLAVAGAGVLAALFGVFLVAFPAAANAVHGGDPRAIDIAVRAYRGATPLEILAFLNIIGHVLFGIAVWRRGLLARAGAVAFAVAPVLQAIVGVYPLEIAGQVLFLLGALAIVVALRREPEGSVTALRVPATAAA